MQYPSRDEPNCSLAVCIVEMVAPAVLYDRRVTRHSDKYASRPKDISPERKKNVIISCQSLASKWPAS